MGSDNLESLHKWKNYEVILENYAIYMYPRISDGELIQPFTNHPNIHRIQAPIMEISSTFIRDQIHLGKNVRPMLPEATWKNLNEMNFYR